MHGISPQQFAESVSSFLVPYYIALAVMNGVAALLSVAEDRAGDRTSRESAADGLVHQRIAVVRRGHRLRDPGLVRRERQSGTRCRRCRSRFATLVNAAAPGRSIYSRRHDRWCWSCCICSARCFVKPAVAWTIWNLMLLFLGLSMPDPNFFAIVTKPDNVPIVALVFLLAFFTWLATYRAVENDDRHGAAAEPPLEKLDDEKVLVWPDLVYTELICMIALSALLIFWAIWLQAPLEEPASSVKTPNPSKAPWYFLGLQEMLVYYDPWMAGVVLPSLIIVGLMAIPYIDFNKQGNGYYTIKQRKFAYIIVPVRLPGAVGDADRAGHAPARARTGTSSARTSIWDAHKVEALNNVNLSEYFWQSWLGHESLPKAAAGFQLAATDCSSATSCCASRRASLLVLGYFIALPPLLAVTVFRRFLPADGLHPLHGAGQPAAVHGVAADQDGAALDVQLEVLHCDPGVLFEFLKLLAMSLASRADSFR